MNISIIVPVYNEFNSISNTIKELEKIAVKLNAEIIIINDGSTDGSDKVINKFQKNKNIAIINHEKNRGYGASLKTGLRHAKGEIIAITDADGTYPNDQLPLMIDKFLKQKLDMLIGSRTGENVRYSFIRKIPKWFITKLANYISNSKIIDINSGLRIFKKEIALKFLNLFPNGFSFTTTITMAMLCHGYEIEYFPIDYLEREGKSKISPIKDTINFFTLLGKIAIYFNPLKFIMPFVFAFSIISAVFIYRDVFINVDLSQSSVLFPVLTVNLFFLGLIADMIVKKFDN